MFRDKIPLHNIGYGVTSRDVPETDKENERPSSNSGLLSRALHDKPILRYVASTAATMAATFVLTKQMEKGGLSLAKTVQRASDSGSKIGRTAVKTALQIKKALDELEGVNRTVEGISDPYSRLFFEKADKSVIQPVLTRLAGANTVSDGATWMTLKEFRSAAAGKEPAAMWSYRDAVQQRLVRASRSLAIALPVTYAVQRVVTDPLFGNNDDRPKVKWYNPADVITDFVTQSVRNITKVVVPNAVAGAAVDHLRMLGNAPYLDHPMPLTANQRRTSNKIADLKTIMESFGQDTEKMLVQASRISASAGYAMEKSVSEATARDGGLLFSMQQARKGAKTARAASELSGEGKLRQASKFAKAYMFGMQDNDETYLGVLDSFSSIKGLPTGLRTFAKQYKAGRNAYDVISGAISFNEGLRRSSGDPNKASAMLTGAIRDLKAQHQSRFSSFINGSLAATDTIDPDKALGKPGSFTSAFERDAYQKTLIRNLTRRGIDKKTAEEFVSGIGIKKLPSVSGSNKAEISYGIRRIISGETNDDEFYQKLIQKAQKELGSKAKNFAFNTIKDAFTQTNVAFTDESYRKLLRERSQLAFQDFRKQILIPQANKIVRPQKAIFGDFSGPLSPSKQEYLVRKTAQSVGIKIVENDGTYVSTSYIHDELAKRGLDATDTDQLKQHLVDAKLMTNASSRGGFNLFGLKPLSVDEAFDKGVLEYNTPEQRIAARRLFAEIAINDPISKTIGFSNLTGVYETKSGKVIDTSILRKGISSFFGGLTHDVKIPVVNFNPLQMIGLGGSNNVRVGEEFQFISGSSRQNFLGETGEAPNVYAWVKQKGGLFGDKGSIVGVTRSGIQTELDEKFGLYKRYSSVSTDLYSRAARLATGAEGVRTSEVEEMQTGTPLSRFEKIRRAFDIGEEQPNSLIRKFGRFRNRKTDINNPTVLARLISEGTIQTGNGRTLSFKVDGTSISTVDQAGRQVHDHNTILAAFDSLREDAQKRAMTVRVMKENEKTLSLPKLDVGGGVFKHASEITTEPELRAAIQGVSERYASLKQALAARNVNGRGLTKSVNSLVNELENSTNLSLKETGSRSPTIRTRQDYLQNQLHKVLIEMHAFEKSAGNPSAIAIELEQALSELKKQNLISPAQLTEARAAGLSILLNISAFSTHQEGMQFGANASSSLRSIIAERDVNSAFGSALKGLVNPYSSQTITNIGASSVSKYANVVRPGFKRIFGAAPYQVGELTQNELGNAGTTFVPTFGTVLERRARGQVTTAGVFGSVIGANSYSSPSTFSAASIPAIHLVDRLNRGLGMVGLGLSNDYSGPLSQYGLGLIGKRALPIAVGAAALITADRTIGGFTRKKDARGQRVYSPYFGTKIARGIVEAQSIMAGIIPGGQNYGETKEQLLNGEVPVRQGRYWPLGITPFKGGKVLYYRPSYYRRMQSGSQYTSDSYGTPLEKFAFGYDFSPLRPFDPYRFERKHYEDRPYPVTGNYFTGPFGPAVPLLNATVGKILKPNIRMHTNATSNALANYVPAGMQGAYDPSGLLSSGKVNINAGQPGAYIATGGSGAGGGFGYGMGGGYGSSQVAGYQIGAYNQKLSRGAKNNLHTARNISFNTISSYNQGYVQAGQYGPPPVPGYIPPRIVPSGKPINESGGKMQRSELGYRVQEMSGIYGFGFSSLRETFGYGQKDFQPNRAVLESADRAYGTTRAFWDLNLGGLGDTPGALGGLELSEITRRFIPKRRNDISYINDIPNTVGLKHPFLPGSDYFINFKTGDPFSKVQEGELRLPGVAFERLNPTRTNYNDPITQLKILGDVAPYSRQYRALDRQLGMGGLDPGDRVETQKIRDQVAQTTQKNDFTPYKYKYTSAKELGIKNSAKVVANFGEYLAHRDTFINNKFFPNRTAQEDWERRNVYGTSFVEWKRPIDSFIKPIYNKATQRNPITAGLIAAGAGSLFGKTATTKAVGSLIGFTTGVTYASYAKAHQAVTNERFIPKDRRKQLALEEYMDMLTFVKNKSLALEANQAGDMQAANQFEQASKRTMYGADIYGSPIDTLALAIPKRKREHFKAMINAPEQERASILSTAPRLERRIFEAAWGMPVEKKPDLIEYFSRHELPNMSWEGWHPNTSMESIKIKVGDSMGINMSQMGYYPQQIREANLINASYPDYEKEEKPKNIAARLRMLMSRNGISGSVSPVMNTGGRSSINISAGVF